MNAKWFMKEIEGTANMGSNTGPHRKVLFKSALQGTAAQRARLLDAPTYQHLQEMFLAKYWSAEIQRQAITALQSESYGAARDFSMES